MLVSSSKQYDSHVSVVVIVNTTRIFVINIHGQYVLFSTVFLVIGVIEHQGRCSTRGVFCNILGENSCKNIYKAMNDGTCIPS